MMLFPFFTACFDKEMNIYDMTLYDVHMYAIKIPLGNAMYAVKKSPL